MIPTLLLPLLLGACDADFEVERDELSDHFRLLAMGVHEGVATAALWSGEGPWHTAAPTLEWSLDGEALGTGWEVAVPPSAAGATLSLVATSGDGLHQVQGELTVQDLVPGLGIERQAVALGPDYDLETRRAIDGSPVETRFPGGTDPRLRLTEPEGGALLLDPEGGTTTWATTAPTGTLLALQPDSTDLAASDLTWDDEAWILDEDDEPGVFAGVAWRPLVFALSRDGAGGNRWAWIELAWEDPDDDAGTAEWELARHEGLLVPAGGTAASLVSGTLSWDPVQGVTFAPIEGVIDLFDQDALPCAVADRPFRLAWVLEGRCAGPELDGATVVIERW